MTGRATRVRCCVCCFLFVSLRFSAGSRLNSSQRRTASTYPAPLPAAGNPSTAGSRPYSSQRRAAATHSFPFPAPDNFTAAGSSANSSGVAFNHTEKLPVSLVNFLLNETAANASATAEEEAETAALALKVAQETMALLNSGEQNYGYLTMMSLMGMMGGGGKGGKGGGCPITLPIPLPIGGGPVASPQSYSVPVPVPSPVSSPTGG